MTFETTIKELNDRYLADLRVPDITGFVDQLFHVAAETGTVACVFNGDKRLRFFVRPAQTRVPGPRPAQAQPTCIVEHDAARAVLRMMCARLGVICKERTATDISPYGGKAAVDHEVENRKHWNISFTNTPDRQEFLIEAL
jgi:hypothetical protein